MKHISLLNDISDTNTNFFRSYKEISNLTGTLYMTYIYEDTVTNERISQSTIPEWNEEYTRDYVETCHLYSNVKINFQNKKTNIILPWETIIPEKPIQKDIILRREEFFIGRNGVSFCAQKDGIRQYLGLAPEIKDSRFLERISKDSKKIIEKMNYLKRIFSNQLHHKRIINGNKC